MRQYMQDRFIVVCGLVLVAVGLWLCTAYESENALFPRICIIGTGALLVLLGINSFMIEKRLKAAGKPGEESLPMNWGPFMVVTLTLAIYGAALIILGFYSSSVLLLLGVGFLWRGVKKSTIVIFTVCFQIFLYVCFTILFKVPLPKGFFI